MTQTSAAAFGAEKPLFRYDLQTEAIEDGGQRFVEVGDPDGGASFRFFEVEYAVACGMDGERDIAALVAWAKTELDLKTNADELGAIVSKLSELQYLGGSEQPQAASSSAQAPKPGPVDEVASLPEIAATPPRVERSSSIDVDLGSSGKSPIAVDRPPAPINVDDVELGVAGASSDQQRAGGDANADAGVELGVAGNEDVAPEDDVIAGPSKEVSTDLSQNFRIDKDEVQAAVRASQVMTAVEMPKDLEDELAASKAAAQKTDEDPIPEDVLLVADISESISDEASDDSSDAIVLPDPPAQVAAASAAEEDASRVDPKKVVGPRRNSASMVLWVILLLAAALGAGYYYMEYVREQPGEKGPDIAPQQAAAKRKAKPKPKAPEAKLAVSEVPTADVSAPRSGVVSWVLAASSDVAEGDEIVKLVGFERADKVIDRHNKSLASYEIRLVAAEGKSAGRIAAIESNVARKKLDIQLANEKRDAFIVRAPIAGVVDARVEAGGRIKAGDVVANVTGAASATVKFTLPAGATAGEGDTMEVVSKDDAELKATCTVTESEGQSVALSCPADSGLGDGANLQLQLP